MNDDKDADADVVDAVAMGFQAGRGRIMFGEYDGSTILVLPESFFSSSSIYIFSRPHNYTYSAAVIGTDDGAEAKHSINSGRPN